MEGTEIIKPFTYSATIENFYFQNMVEIFNWVKDHDYRNIIGNKGREKKLCYMVWKWLIYEHLNLEQSMIYDDCIFWPFAFDEARILHVSVFFLTPVPYLWTSGNVASGAASIISHSHIYSSLNHWAVSSLSPQPVVEQWHAWSLLHLEYHTMDSYILPQFYCSLIFFPR